MTKADPIVLFDIQAGVARITMNRPEKRNALNDELIAGIRNSLGRAHHDENVHAVVLTGAGADFCSGADLSALQKIAQASVTDNLEDARSLLELFLLIREVRVPVIAAVRSEERRVGKECRS